MDHLLTAIEALKKLFGSCDFHSSVRVAVMALVTLIEEASADLFEVVEQRRELEYQLADSNRRLNEVEKALEATQRGRQADREELTTAKWEALSHRKVRLIAKPALVNGKILPIKFYRKWTGVTLAQSKAVIDRIGDGARDVTAFIGNDEHNEEALRYFSFEPI
jgi:ribosomal protein L7/L12